MDQIYIYLLILLSCLILFIVISVYVYYQISGPKPTIFTKINMTKEPELCNDNTGKWIITVDDVNLVFKDTTTTVNNGYYFDLDGRVDYGNKNNNPNTINYTNGSDESGHIMTFGNWIMAEDMGKFVIYNNSVMYYAKYIFYPNSGVVTFGKGVSKDKTNCTIAKGKRWVVKIDDGYLTFLDTRSTGDNRYVFCPGYGVDINNTGINLVNMRKTEML